MRQREHQECTGERPSSSFPKHWDPPLTPAALPADFGANTLLLFMLTQRFLTQEERKPPFQWQNDPSRSCLLHDDVFETKVLCRRRKNCQNCKQKLFSCWLSFCTNYYAESLAAYFLLNFCMNKGYSACILRSILKKVSLIIFNAMDF